MRFDPTYISKLILDAHQLLEQDNLEERTKNALTDCLKTVRSSGHLTADEEQEIDSLIGN